MNYKIRQISNRNTTHLYWGVFPYKVETTFPAKKFIPSPSLSNAVPRQSGWRVGFFNQMVYELEHKRYITVVNNFRKSCNRFLPANDDWKLLETEKSFHYYFVHKEDMDRFVAGNRKKIRAVYRPEVDTQIELMAGLKDTKIRHSLFHDRYRFCIVFKHMSSQAFELDAWVKDFFGDDRERIGYKPFGSRRLYLNIENDILMTRLAFSRYILRVEKIILRSEIVNGSTISKEIGGEGCDP